MVIILRNKSSSVTSAELEKVVAALNRQIAEHFQPAWDISGTVEIEDPADPVAEPDGVVELHKQPKYESFHWDPTGTPTAIVDTEISTWQAEHLRFMQWSVALSHEILEMLTDPDLKRTVVGPHPDADRQVEYCVEICDPVQADVYSIDGVDVINFVLPAYYDASTPAGPATNHLGEDLAPLGWTKLGEVGFWDKTVTKNGGYVIYPPYDPGHPVHTKRSVMGKKSRLAGYGQLRELRAPS